MRNAILVLSLLVTANASAVRVEVAKKATFAPIASQRKANVLRDARAAFTLRDGSQWITHSVPAQSEPSAIGVTRFGADGTAQVFLLSDWLPNGAIPRGWCGQVYGVALLDDGRIAVSGGWTDGRASHNAIFVLHAREGGGYDTDKVIELPGVAHIVDAPRNTILAVTDDPNLHGGGPLLAVYDPTGRRLARLFDQHDAISPAEAARNATNVRLRRVSDKTVAFYEPSSERVIVFDMDVADDEVIVSGRQIIFIGDDASTAHLPVLGIDSWENGDLLVARMGMIRGVAGTQLTVYGRDHSVKQSVTLDRPWNLMLREKDRIHGVVRKGDVSLDTVALRFND